MKSLKLGMLIKKSKVVRLITVVGLAMLIFVALFYVLQTSPLSHADSNILYVDGTLGNDTGDCTNQVGPCATIGYALNQTEEGDTILVAKGVYTENLLITKTVTLKGAYEPIGWLRSLRNYTTVISGSGSNAVIRIQSTTLSKTTEINGFTITNGDLITGIGGISVLSSSVIIDNCKIVHNHTTGSGGGMRIDRSIVTITNTIIADNEADGNAGAIHIISPSDPQSMVYINNSTIVNNSAVGPNGIFVSLSGCNVVNSIVWGHEGEDFGGLGYHATYSDIEMGLSGIGNFSMNPRFVDSANGDYHLRQDSPCIDSGANQNSPMRDFEGDLRPTDGNRDGTTVTDIGADEFIFPIYFPIILKNT